MTPLRSLLLVFMLAAGWMNLVSAEESTISPKQALDVVQADTAGKILSNELKDKQGTPAYRIKVLTDQGVVKILFVDANTGKILQ